MINTGTIRLEDGFWVIDATPDVIIWLKRVLPQAHQSKLGTLLVKDSPQVAFDLQWVRQRFPMAVPEDRYLKKQAKSHTQRIERLQKMESAPIQVSDFQMAVPPRDYQCFGARMMLEQQGMLLADKLGLGKTCSAICTFTDKRTLPALVVVQAHLPIQWKDEIQKFLPTARVHIIKQVAHYELPPADVYIVTYRKLSSWKEILGTIIKSVTFDECQELRVGVSEQYHSAKLIADVAKFRFGLSATPIYGYGPEIFNVVDVLSPGSLGTRDEFLQEWCVKDEGKETVKDTNALGHYLRNNFLMLRRTRKDVGRELPPLKRYVNEVSFDRHVFDAGASATEELARLVLHGTFTERGMATRQLDLRVRQATGLAKAPYVGDFARMLIESGKGPILVSGWHRSVYDLWAKRLADLNPVFYTGEESTKQKERSKRMFMDGESQLMFLSNRSGSGLDGLQHVCCTGLIGELDWSPKVIDQWMGRLHRDGQKKEVEIFFPVAPVGSDPMMSGILGIKRAQSSGIVELDEDESDLSLLETDPYHIKTLAEEFLRSRGVIFDVPARRAESFAV